MKKLSTIKLRVINNNSVNTIRSRGDNIEERKERWVVKSERYEFVKINIR